MRVSLLIGYISLFSCVLLFTGEAAVACVPPPVPSISSSGPLTFCSGQSVTLTASSGAGYSYMWKKNGNNISGATNSTYAATASGSYTVVVTVDTCNNTSLPAVVTVNSNPIGTLTNDHSLCQGSSTTLVAGGGSSYNWSAGGANNNTLTVTPNSTASYSVTVSNSFGCNDVKSVQVTVKPMPISNISVAGSSTLCEGQNVNLNANSGAGYTYQWCLNHTPISGATGQTLTVSATGEYQVITSLNGCSRESAPKIITVNPVPVPVVSDDITICAGQTVNLFASGGTSYQWSGGGPATASYDVTPTSTRTYTVTVTNAYSCTASDNVIITVKPLPNASISLSGSAILCQGQSANLNASNGTGYSHQWYKNSTLLNGETNASITASSVGDYYVGVTLNGCIKTSATVTVTVNPLPVPVVSDDATICAGQTVNLYASGGTSYQWGGGGPATAGYDVVPTSTKIYTVTVTNVYGCTASADVTITVKPLPNANISLSGSAILCQGQSVNLNASNGTGYSHQWYINNGLMGGETNPSFSATVSGIYHAVVNLNACTKTSSPMTITVNPVPIPVVSDDVTTCAGDTVTLQASGGTGYQWSSGGPATATNVVAPAITKIYTVTVTNSFSCSASASVTVTVKPLPNANISISGSTTLCNGQTVNLAASNGTGYSHQWYKNYTILAGETNPTYTVSVAGEYYVVVALNGCSKESAHHIFTVNQLPNMQASNDTTICIGDTVVLFASGGTSYQWSAGGPTTSTYSVAPVSTKTYSVTASNSVGCSATADIVVTVRSLPQANISLSGGTTLCSGQSVNMTASNGTGYSHQWYKNNGLLNGATNNIFSVTTSGDYMVMVSLNGCQKSSAHQVFTVNPIPVPVVNSDATTCAGDTVILQASGGTGYQWNSGGPASATYVVAPTSSKTYTVTVTNSFSCSASASVDITVKPRPTANISLSGGSTICSGQSVAFNASNGAGYSHQWYKDNTFMNGQTNPLFTASSSGDYYVVVTLDGCQKMSSHQIITVNPLPVPQVTSDMTICAGNTVNLQASGGTSYQWSSGGPATSGYSVVPVSTKTYTVTVTNSFGCSASANVIITVKPLPQAWISTAGSTTLCEGQSVSFNTASTQNHVWYRNGSIIPGASSNAYTATLAGQYYVINTLDGCSNISDTIAVTVNPLPLTNISSDVSICAGDTLTLTASGGVLYNWNTGPTTPSITVSTTSTRTYSVTISDANSCSVLRSVTVSTVALPNASVSVSGPTTFCANRTLTLNASTGAGYSYQWFKNYLPVSAANNSQFIVAQTGIYFVKVTANGCSKNSNTTTATVNPVPTSIASNDTTICSGDTIHLYVSGGSSFQWSNGSTANSIQITPTNNANYSVTVSNSLGCTASESVAVSTIARPTAVVSPIGTISVCQGETATLTASSGTGYSYQWMEGISQLNGKTNQSLDVTTPGNYYVLVKQNGCPKKSNTVQVIVNPIPVVTVSNDITICGGDQVALSASGGSTYKWNTGSSNSSITITPNTSTTYNVTVTSSSGCSVTDDVYVSVLPSPTASITSSGSLTLCQGQSVIFNASTGSPYTYQWKNNGVAILGQTGSSFTANQTGNYSVAVSILSCTKTSSVQSVVVNSLPTAVVSDDTTICQGNSAEVSASGGATYRWSNGRITAVNSVSPNQTSIYIVTVTDANGCPDTSHVTVNVTALPNAYISSSSSTNLCTGQTATLNASTGIGYSYIWYKDGVEIPAADASSYIAGQTGNFTVQTTSNGCSKISLPSIVTVNSFLVATISSDTTLCAGESVTITATGGSTYDWNTGDTTSTIIVAPTNTKTYSVTVSNSVNCSSVKSSVITVNPLPNAFILVTGGVTGICKGQTATMTASSGAGLSYQWMKDMMEIQGENSVQYIASDSGSYTVMVSQKGCNKLSAPKTISVNPLPVVSLSKDVTICSGTSTTLHVAGGVSYLWNTYATDSVYTVTPTSTKSYSVTATNSFGCKSADTVAVTTIPLPTNVSISSTNTTNICEGDSVTLKAGSTNGILFQWQLDSVNIPGASSNTYKASKQGSYSLVVTGSNGCSKTSSLLKVSVKARPETPEVIKIGGDTLSSSVIGSNYKWFRNGVPFNTGSQTVRVAKSGAYTVNVSDNGCSSDTSAPYYYYMTGVVQNDIGELAIYPNPSSGIFQIELPVLSGQEINVKVLNTLGQIVWKGDFNKMTAQRVTIDISNLTSGIYFVNIQSAEKKFSGRLIVNQ